MKKIIYIFFVCIAFLAGCNLFSTRTPETPINKKSSYVPPTSSDIVIKNLQASIAEKNVDDYISCLSEFSDISGSSKFTFKPTSDVFAAYASIFQNWNLDAERKYFNTMINRIPNDIVPDLKLFNQQTIALQPDSVMYAFDYILNVQHSLEGAPKIVSGTMQLTIILKQATGLWSISTWIDTKSSNDTIPYSWSWLKVKFFN